MRAIDLLRWMLAGLAILVAGQAALGFLGLFDGTASAAFAVLFALGSTAAAWRADLLSFRRPLLDGWRPLESSYLAECVQVPFALLAAIAIYATARELGAGRAAALGAVLAFLLIPEVRLQASISMVDLAIAALFLATLPFLVRLWREPNARDFLALATAWGLFLGTKYIALPFSAPLLAAAAAILWRHRRELRRSVASSGFATLGPAALAMGLIFATGGFWYLRNLWVTGNPIYPLDTEILGLWQLDGLYNSALMRQWVYHAPVADFGRLGWLLLSCRLAFALAGAVALAVRWRGPETALAIVQVAVFWFVVPYQHSRFLFAFFGVVAVALATATSSGRAAMACRLLLAAAIVMPWLQWPDPIRFAAVAGLGGAALPLIERRLSMRLPALAAGVALAVAVAAGLGPYRDRYPGFAHGYDLQHAWQWVHENVSGAHVAYTGSNLPFPLHGRDLGNRVTYVNVALGPEARVHDFPDRPFTTAEPTLYRDGADFETWLANLRQLGCDTLFVNAMFPIVRRQIEHDAEGFPVERAWADAHPEIFRPRYANPIVRIYQVRSN